VMKIFALDIQLELAFRPKVNPRRLGECPS